MTAELGMVSENGTVKPTLESVRLEGRVEGLLMTMKMRQHYVNESKETIEAVYTFPAGWGSNLLGFNVEIDGKRLNAVALEKKAAEKKYEKAIESGDTPVMLEVTAQGLYTANLGNLKSGEEAIIEIEYAQMLRCVKGNVRISIPTVIGNRYGDQQSQAHLLGHQTVSTDSLCEYPLMLKLDLSGELSKGEISCPSHLVKITDSVSGKTIEIDKGAYLDRDFVLNIDSIKGDSFVVVAPDGDEYAVIASFCPELPKTENTPILLKILVDCSGSMQGESIEQVRTALDALTQQIGEQDFVSYSKFGSAVKHVTKKMERATKKFIKNTLAKAILKTDANLGGTEIKSSLLSTYLLPVPSDDKQQAVNVLLITDGDVWEVEAAIKDAKKHKHRIFAIGVGSAPAESLLRELALGTGGACELVTPSESIEEATLRMFERMRSVQASKIEIKWSSDSQWMSALPTQIFSEEMVHLYATVKTIPTEMPALVYKIDGEEFSCQANTFDLLSNINISRICAAAQITSTKKEKIATQLALKYQLPSQYTNLILVHERVDEEKANGLPTLKQIKQMQAAGWGGFGQTVQVRYSNYQVSACRSMGSSFVAPSNAVPSVWRTSRTQASAKVDQMARGGLDNYQVPLFLRQMGGSESFEHKSITKIEIEIDKGFPPRKVIEYINILSLRQQVLSDVIDSVSSILKDSTIWHFLLDEEKFGIEDETEIYWCVMINWLSESLGGGCTLERHAQRLLNSALILLDASVKIKMETNLQNKFPSIRESSWATYPKEARTLRDKVKDLLKI